MVQWLRLHIPVHREQVQILVGELSPHAMRYGLKVKNKVKNKNKDMKVNSKKGTTGKRI